MYFGWCVVAYVLGLCTTLAANICGWTFNGVQGQPALLYLVPCTLGAVALRALFRRELGALWHGTALRSSEYASIE